MKFKSKVDWWMHITLLLIVAFNIWALIYFIMSGGIFMLVILIIFTPLTVLYIIPVWFNTYYVLGEDGLLIKCGLRKGYTVPYESIISAVSTKDPLASHALSMDRIEVKYRLESKKFSDTVLISPNDKQEFFIQLGIKNEDINITTETKPMEKGYKLFLKVVLALTGAVMLGSAVMMVVGEFDPVVNLYEDRITISGMYGTTIRTDNLYGISLIESSMRDIPGSGSIRTNGFDGFGQAQKGYFTSQEFGANIRFVQAKTAPTIHIKRRAQDIFISFRDGDKTRELFDEMQKFDWFNITE